MKAGIIGGGISGLMVAYQLQKMGISYDIFEQAEQPGGNIKTMQVKQYLLEMGPTTLQMCPELLMLIKELKLEKEMIVPASGSQKRYVFHEGQFRALPGSIIELLTSTFFSLKTKYQILQERLTTPPPAAPNETVSQFFERHFGREVVDLAVEPLVMSIYAGNPDTMLMAQAFPQLVKYEGEYGSVVRGLLANHAFNRRQAFSLKGGLQTLTNAIASKLIELHTGTPAEMITKSKGKYIVSTNSPDYVSAEYDVLVLAIPAHKAMPLLEFTYPGLAAALTNVAYPPLAVVHTAYRKSAVGVPLAGYGALHPRAEDQFSAGVIWNSSIYPGSCPDGEALFTTIVGGAAKAENAQMPRTEILRLVNEELRQTYQISAERPLFQHFYLWHHALPQFDLYREDAHEMAKTMENENVFVASNWFSGVSVPDCIRRANEVAKKIKALATGPTG